MANEDQASLPTVIELEFQTTHWQVLALLMEKQNPISMRWWRIMYTKKLRTSTKSRGRF